MWENGVGKSRWFTYHLEREDISKMKEKWEEIGHSLQTTLNDFAGTYFQYGYMAGYFLRWSPDHGYIYIQYFDIEHPCYFSFGKAVVRGVEVDFITEFETKESRCPGKISTPKVWIPTQGGKYFIPKNEAKRFGSFYGGYGNFNQFGNGPKTILLRSAGVRTSYRNIVLYFRRASNRLLRSQFQV